MSLLRSFELMLKSPLSCVFLALMIGGCAGSARNGAAAARSVGFRSFWTLDSARTYRTAFDDGVTYGATKRPRPVLVNVWYPAVGTNPRMIHEDYLRIEPSDDLQLLAPLAGKLVEYERSVITGELLGSKPDSASQEAMGAYERTMRRVTKASREAVPASGPFPLVIYHGGAGSSFEDNALLCEDLAQNGFVVIGGAFQLADGSSFNVDSENAGREVEFLLRIAGQMHNVDLTRVGIVGHSAGAQAALIYGSQPGTAIDAVVSLDTTQDYRTPADPRWPQLVSSLTRAADTYVTPTMFVAGPQAIFGLADKLTRCNRVYLTVPNLKHSQFVSQGEAAAYIAAQTDDTSGKGNAETAERVAKQGARLRSCVIDYFEAELRGCGIARSRIRARSAAVYGSEIHAMEVPVGSTYSDKDPSVPTPRGVYRAYVTGGPESVARELASVRPLDPNVFDDYFAFQLMYDAASNGREADVKRLFDFFVDAGVDVTPILIWQADRFAPITPDFARGCVLVARSLGSTNPEVLRIIAEHGSEP